jgi:actin-related protein 8
MFLVNLGFSSIYVHAESVLATFGANINNACVVDVGYQKINICCVEEGIIVPNTLVRKNFGGDDIDIVFSKLLARKHAAIFKKKGLKVSNLVYWHERNAI